MHLVKNYLHLEDNMKFVEGASRITTGDRIKDNDERRSKGKCIYFNHSTCQYNGKFSRGFIRLYTEKGELKCTGSAHCPMYKEVCSTENKKKQKLLFLIKIVSDEGTYYLTQNEEGEKIYTEDVQKAKRFSVDVCQQMKKKFKNNINVKIIIMT